MYSMAYHWECGFVLFVSNQLKGVFKSNHSSGFHWYHIFKCLDPKDKEGVHVSPNFMGKFHSYTSTYNKNVFWQVWNANSRKTGWRTKLCLVCMLVTLTMVELKWNNIFVSKISYYLVHGRCDFVGSVHI